MKLAPFDGVTPDAGDERARNDLIEAGMARVAAVVERVRGRARVQVDCHSRFRPAEAPSILTRLARIGISWFEEPILETADARPVLAALRRQAQSLGVILAGAEKAADLAEFLPFGLDGCYDVLMPDIVLAGGPGEVMRIGHFAAAHGVGLSLHNPCGPVMDMHSAHVAACVPRLQSLERQFRESPLYDAIVTRAHDDTGGTITLGDAPGLGLTVDWDHPQVTPVAGFDIAL